MVRGSTLFASLILFSCSFLQLIPNAHGSFHISGYFGPNCIDAEWTQWIPDPIYVGAQDGLMEPDKIDKLPGQPSGVDFNQYAGYVTVNPEAGRALFYYFVESPQDPDKKPLILWLTGGPGCSSLGGGAMLEVGPLKPNSDGQTLRRNDYSWNQVANVIFLESPAGVGFSYSNTTSDYMQSGDKRTTNDTYTFLVNWLDRFPEYKNRDFYMVGESYSGHYIPELASTILTKNKNNTNGTVINLKGIAMGNAVFDYNMNTKFRYEYLWTHGFMSDETHEAITSKCSFASQTNTKECSDILNAADAEMGNIDRTNVYAPVCPRNGDSSTGFVPDPCDVDYVRAYMNRPDVQNALHATQLPYPWTPCSASTSVNATNWTDSPATMLPTVKSLTGSGIRVWVYSGDQDSMVPISFTKYFVHLLDLPVEESWRPWYVDPKDAQIAGYVVAHKGLTFATVRGAGHMVPKYQPQRALTLISHFLEGNSLPKKG